MIVPMLEREKDIECQCYSAKKWLSQARSSFPNLAGLQLTIDGRLLFLVDS